MIEVETSHSGCGVVVGGNVTTLHHASPGSFCVLVLMLAMCADHGHCLGYFLIVPGASRLCGLIALPSDCIVKGRCKEFAAVLTFKVPDFTGA